MTGVELQVIIDVHFWVKALMLQSFSLTYATCCRAWCPLAVFPFEHQLVGDRLVLRDCVFEFNSWIFGLKQELRNKNKRHQILQEDSTTRSKDFTLPEERLRKKGNNKEGKYNTGF